MNRGLVLDDCFLGIGIESSLAAFPAFNPGAIDHLYETWHFFVTMFGNLPARLDCDRAQKQNMVIEADRCFHRVLGDYP